jgi:FixJ family two-component response regulator
MNYMRMEASPLREAVVTENILVIDDETDWLCECEFMLGSLGYASVTASSATEALLRIEDHSISTIIIDYNMPGCDGLTLMEQLTALARTDGRSLRFIMATGHATLEIAVGAMRVSAVDFLEKPVSREQLQKSLLRVRGVELERPARSALVSQLESLSAEMQRISSIIASPTAAHGTPQPAPAANSSKMADPAFIRRLLRNEAKRRQLGNGALFGDPAWDMLLDLTIARLEGRHVSVSSACIASGAPTTTALRLVNRLVGESILGRIPDEKDGRRDFLVIDPTIEGPLIAYLNELAKAS